MICEKCGRELGGKPGQIPGYSHSWKKVNGACTRITLCSFCEKGFDWCIPSKKEEDAYFFKEPEVIKKTRKEKRRQK
jgi:hypothetical protein